MTALALGTMLIGMVLGIRFRVIILPPIILDGSAILSAIAFFTSESAGHALLSIIVFACVLQLGYLCTALVVASIFHGDDKEEHEQKPRAARLAWKRLPARRDAV